MKTSATLKHARLSPQKMRLIADQIRGLPVDRALSILTFSNKKAASIIKKFTFFLAGWTLFRRRLCVQCITAIFAFPAGHHVASLQPKVIMANKPFTQADQI